LHCSSHRIGVNPALDQFTDLARELRQEAEAQARRHGRELGAGTAAALVA
jgi:FMN-dependent NADH-azoreductase